MSVLGTFPLTTQSFQSLTNDTTSNTQKPGQPFFPCNNEENLIAETTARRVDHIFHIGIIPCIEILGIIANIINLIIFIWQGLADRINLCLFSLALADLTYLLLSFSAQFVLFIGFFNKELLDFWNTKYLETLLGPMRGTIYVSNMLTMIISVERCVCVVSPFTAKKYLRTRNMAVFIVIMAVYILVVYSLVNLKYDSVLLTNPVTNVSHWVPRLSDFFLENMTVLNIVYNYLLSLTIPCVSLIVVITTTSITVMKLRQTAAWRKENVNNSMSAGDRREAAVTKMLTVICLIYVTTMTPSVTQSFALTFIPGYQPSGKYCNMFIVVQTVVHVFEVINSSVNFIVYFTMGSKFREIARQLFRRGTHTKRSSTQSSATVSEDLK